MNSIMQEADRMRLHQRLGALRGNLNRAPDASIIIPVNAQGDLQTVLLPLEHIGSYKGKFTVEIILVINNYPVQDSPPEIEQFRELGIHVVAVPSARQPGEVVIMSARALGVRAATSNVTIHFDADCRIPDIDAYLEWCIPLINSGCQLAYSGVGFYDIQSRPSIHAKIAIHHTLRWWKRNLLRIPTTRGSNYVIERTLFLQLYDAGKLSVDLQVGPAAKLAGARIVYSGQPNLVVYTSGRRFQGGWLRILRYLRYRFQYNIKAIPTLKRDVDRTSWIGFDQESERRKVLTIPKKQDG